MPKYRFDTTNHLNDMCITVQSLLLQTTTSERNLDLFMLKQFMLNKETLNISVKSFGIKHLMYKIMLTSHK